MGDYNSIKEKIIQQIPVQPSLASLRAAFDLFKIDLAREILLVPGVVDEVVNDLDNLSQHEHFLVFILNTLPFSDIYYQIKKEYLHLNLVWEKIVELEKIPVTVSGTYFTGDNQAVIKSEGLSQADIILENKDHAVINSLNKLEEKVGFNFQATLQKGSLFTYQGLIDLTQYEDKIKQISLNDQKESENLKSYRKITNKISGIALSLSMALTIVGCGANPEDKDQYGEVPPYNNSPDCQIRRAEFYNRLSRLSPGMNEETVNRIIDPTNDHYDRGYMAYNVSYTIPGFDYSVKGVVICEVVQLHFDTFGKYRTYTSRTFQL